LAAFVARYAEDAERLADILAKTWREVSERGHQAATSIPPPPNVVSLPNNVSNG
jgi:hypothetical protein